MSGCFTCKHFVHGANDIEDRLHGLSVFSSGAASVRDADGLCTQHDRLVACWRMCDRFAWAEARRPPAGVARPGRAVDRLRGRVSRLDGAV